MRTKHHKSALYGNINLYLLIDEMIFGGKKGIEISFGVSLWTFWQYARPYAKEKGTHVYGVLILSVNRPLWVSASRH